MSLIGYQYRSLKEFDVNKKFLFIGQSLAMFGHHLLYTLISTNESKYSSSKFFKIALILIYFTNPLDWMKELMFNV